MYGLRHFKAGFLLSVGSYLMATDVAWDAMSLSLTSMQMKSLLCLFLPDWIQGTYCGLQHVKLPILQKLVEILCRAPYILSGKEATTSGKGCSVSVPDAGLLEPQKVSVSTLDWEVNVSWSPLGSGHPQSGEGTPSPRGPRHCTELMEISKLGLKGLWRRWCLFPHILTHCSHSRHLFLPSQLCCPQSSQAARITAAPTPCHGKGSTWWWLRVTTVPGTWAFLASCHSDRSRLAH